MVAKKKKLPEKNDAGTPGSELSLRGGAEEQLARSPKPSPDLAGKTPEQLVHELQVHQIELETQAEELRNAQLALVESRDKYLDLYDFAPIGYLSLTDKALIEDVNLSGAALLGVLRNDLINHGIGRFILPGDLEKWDQYFIKVRQHIGKQVCTLMFTREDGSIFPARLEGVQTTVSGAATKVRITFNDISDIWQIEALKEREMQLRATLEATADGILAVDNQGKILQASRRFAEIWKIPPSLMEGGNDRILLDFVLDQLTDPEAFLKKVQLLYGSDAVDMDTLIFKDNRVIERYSFPMIMDGARIGRVWSFRDITDRKRAEELLQESEEMFRTLLEQVPSIAVQGYRPDHTVVYWNEANTRIYGYTAEEAIGRDIRDLLVPIPAHDEVTKAIARMAETGIPEPSAELELLHKNGSLVPVFSSHAVVKIPGRSTIQFCFDVDLSDRKKAEDTIRKNEERFRTIINSMQFGIVIIDAQTHTILEANPKALEMIGGTSESVFGSVCHRFICPAELGKCPVTDLLQTVDSSERVLLNLREEKIPILKSVIKTMLGGKEVLIESFINITDRKLTEDTLIKVNQKLNVLSQLTRQDLTTQIFVLNSYLEMAKTHATGQDGIIKNIESGERAIKFIKEITEFTKDYQNMGEKPPKYQNVKLSFLFGLSHISIGEIQHSLETENLEIFTDPLLEKAFQGMLENSVKHGGHVSHIRVSHTITPDSVTIVFEDDGVGIPNEKKERIFLRGEGARASVRGLVFVQEILDITGITIRETGVQGKGARFEMMVPKGSYRLQPDKGTG